MSSNIHHFLYKLQSKVLKLRPSVLGSKNLFRLHIYGDPFAAVPGLGRVGIISSARAMMILIDSVNNNGYLFDVRLKGLVKARRHGLWK